MAAKHIGITRKETKYLVTSDQYRQIISMIGRRLEADSHTNEAGLYRVSSLYYDSPANEFLRTASLKPGYRRKLRIRTYNSTEKHNGEPTAIDQAVFLEIKAKYQGTGFKRRIELAAPQAMQFMRGGSIPVDNGRVRVGSLPVDNGHQVFAGSELQVLKEVAFLRDSLSLQPSLHISYVRRVFDSGELRISFDTDIRCRKGNLGLQSSDEDISLLPEGFRVMEIKTSAALPLWLAELLSAAGIHPQPFSKFAEAHRLLSGGATDEAQWHPSDDATDEAKRQPSGDAFAVETHKEYQWIS